jgi:predicted Zn finger-like uncharacterized protein
MYSQCPECQTRFRVTADALRAAHGTVRCGRCGGAFDALERLSDSIPPPAREMPEVPLLVAADVATGPGTATGAEYHFSAEDLERVFVEAADWQDPFLSPPPVAADAREPVGIGTEPPIVVVHDDATVEDITLEGERVRVEESPAEAVAEFDLDSTDELEILRHVEDSAYPDDDEETERELQALARQLAEESPPLQTAAAPVDPGVRAEPIAAAETAGEERGPPEEAFAPAPPPPPVPLAAQRWRTPVVDTEPEPTSAASPWRTLAWTMASLLLALVLAAQLIHFYRQDLVRHPQAGPLLRAAYERVGLALLPNWDLAAFELRQWGNDAGAAAQGRMVVRASLTNRASFAQPHPILRLELEDRFGVTVATREFEPADYLKNPSQASRLIASGSSSEAELLLADPGPEAVGYRLDVCLRESAALLRCARGPG